MILLLWETVYGKRDDMRILYYLLNFSVNVELF